MIKADWDRMEDISNFDISIEVKRVEVILVDYWMFHMCIVSSSEVACSGILDKTSRNRLFHHVRRIEMVTSEHTDVCVKPNLSPYSLLS